VSVSHIEKSIDLADKLTARAEEALSDLELEMTLRKWPADFRAIMWDAVALVAQSRAAAARS
jgi:hypothetical protein